MTAKQPQPQLLSADSQHPAGEASAIPRLGLLFSYDWDEQGFGKLAPAFEFDPAGFDLFAFPSNAQLVGFDLEKFSTRQARLGKARGWAGVISHHEQFGALAAAMVAEKLGLPGTPVQAILACQHKLHARQVMQQVCPEANLPFQALNAAYGSQIPRDIRYPAYVKPVKAAFSVLARRVDNHAELHQHTRFGHRELWVIRRLVEPFERVARARLPDAGTAHRLLLEQPVQAEQFNLDGYVFKGQAHALGVVDAIMYPGTQAFMRWDYPSRLASPVQARALEISQRFLSAVGFDHGMFNIEFFYDAASDTLSIIEVNPRLASQFSDLYQRVQGLQPHAMSVALALGQDPAGVARLQPVAGAAASLVYRVFKPEDAPSMPSQAQQAALAKQFADADLFLFPKSRHALARDFKWLGSYRYGIIHLQGKDAAHLRQRCEAASALLGWAPPYADQRAQRSSSSSSAHPPEQAGNPAAEHLGPLLPGVSS
jgi:hypothetical protein